MYSIVYVSAAVKPFTKEELLELLSVARNNNTKLDVTGMLVYKDGDFMQVLEGDEETVRKLYAKIDCDTRHRRTMIILQGPVASRAFPDWSMAFYDLTNTEELRAIAGYSEFLNTPLTGMEFAQNPARAQKLLHSFKEAIR